MVKVLTKDRFDHTLGVAYTAAALAMRHGADIQKALTAGMLHDCAKCLKHEEQLRICQDNELPVSDIELRNPSLLHAKAGAFLAKTRYHVDDPEILDAIRYHTTGRPDMTKMDKIIYIADFIEPNRKMLPEMDQIRAESFADLDLGLFHILKNTLSYLDQIKKECDPKTSETYKYYQKEQAKKG